MLLSSCHPLKRCPDRRRRHRSPDWVGAHLPPLDVPCDSAAIIAVQLTDPASGATRIFVRGAADCGCDGCSRLMAAFKQQVLFSKGRAVKPGIGIRVQPLNVS